LTERPKHCNAPGVHVVAPDEQAPAEHPCGHGVVSVHVFPLHVSTPAAPHCKAPSVHVFGIPPVPPIPLLVLAPPIPLLVLAPPIPLLVLAPPIPLLLVLSPPEPPFPPELGDPPSPPLPTGLSGSQPGVAAARSRAMCVNPMKLRLDMYFLPRHQNIPDPRPA